MHPDHSGNVDEFPDATVVIQKAEWDYAATFPQKPFAPEHKLHLIEGDKDMFGDGSVVILSTPGHTPGHQSLLVHLGKTGNVVLSGDVAHFQSNWENRRIADFNYDKAQSLASMEKIARILKEKHAQLWINHDKPSSDARSHAPDFYECRPSSGRFSAGYLIAANLPLEELCILMVSPYILVALACAILARLFNAKIAQDAIGDAAVAATPQPMMPT